MALVHHRGWAPRAFAESRWYFPIRASWLRFAEHPSFPHPEQLSHLYVERTRDLSDFPSRAAGLRFAAVEGKSKRKRGAPIQLTDLYEGRIVERGEVPTRVADWHDFFNALSFVAFPRAKWALHHRQYTLWKSRITPGQTRLPGARTREQDALSLFDEGGIALAVLPEHVAQLDPNDDSFDARIATLCNQHQALPVPFGHALYEHLVEGLPCPLGTVHVIPLQFEVNAPETCLGALDAALARDLDDARQFTLPSPARGLALNER